MISEQNKKISAKKLSGFQGALSKINETTPIVFSIVTCLALFIGWRLRNSELLIPQHGMGYKLGIIGTFLMGVLFIYPLRKRVQWFAVIGSMRSWFRIHMALGILGPLCILYHCNFHLGSMNSNVALVSMVIVSLSGIAGRFIYARIHHGLYGQRADLIELREEFQKQKEEVGVQFALIPGIKEDLLAFAQGVLNAPSGFVHSAGEFLTIGLKSMSLKMNVSRKTNHYLNTYAAEHGWGWLRKWRMQRQIQRKVRFFLRQAAKTARFNFYERLFSLWHMLHIPLVIVLVLAVIVHIIAVRAY